MLSLPDLASDCDRHPTDEARRATLDAGHCSEGSSARSSARLLLLMLICFFAVICSLLSVFSTFGRSVILRRGTCKASTISSSHSSRSSFPPTSVRAQSPYLCPLCPHFNLPSVLISRCLLAAQTPTQKRLTWLACLRERSMQSRPTRSGVSPSYSTGSRTTTSLPNLGSRGASRRWRSWSAGSIVSSCSRCHCLGPTRPADN